MNQAREIVRSVQQGLEFGSIESGFERWEIGKSDGKIIYFKGTNPGGINSMLGLVDGLAENGYKVVIDIGGDKETGDKARKRLEGLGGQVSDANVLPDMLILAGDVDTKASLDLMWNYYEVMPEGKVSLLEDSPGSLDKLLWSMMNDEKRHGWAERWPKMVMVATMFTVWTKATELGGVRVELVGNPDFDNIISGKEMTDGRRDEIRKLLGVEEDELVVGLVGKPEGDAFELDPLMDHSLQAVFQENFLRSLVDAMIDNPTKRVRVVNLPHPRGGWGVNVDDKMLSEVIMRRVCGQCPDVVGRLAVVSTSRAEMISQGIVLPGEAVGVMDLLVSMESTLLDRAAVSIGVEESAKRRVKTPIPMWYVPEWMQEQPIDGYRRPMIVDHKLWPLIVDEKGRTIAVARAMIGQVLENWNGEGWDDLWRRQFDVPAKRLADGYGLVKNGKINKQTAAERAVKAIGEVMETTLAR